jgi:DNA-binding LacI/PurR family transcriptional regulator
MTVNPPAVADRALTSPSRPATSAAVARLAGVSRSTVSQVLNGQAGRFAPETVQRVLVAAAELDYVRSAAGRALVTGRSDFIVVVVPERTLTRLQDVVEVIAADIKQLGFTAVAHFPPSRAEPELPSRLQRVVEALRPAGVIDLGGLSRGDRVYLRDFGCPVLSQLVEDDLNPYIGKLQAEHLIARGYREIAYAFLTDGRADTFSAERIAGVAAACAVAGLQSPGRIDVLLDADAAGCALQQLLDRHSGRIGIACYNDEVALALVYAAQRLGVAVPARVGLVGVDRTDVGQIVSPRLTTVSADVADSLSPMRTSIAQTYGATAAGVRASRPRDIVQLLEGETS